MALPNGLPMVVSFFAAAMAGTAAPLNPAYKEDEFRFFLGDTEARVLILAPQGIDDARRAAGDSVRIMTIDVDANGTVGFLSARHQRSGRACRHVARTAAARLRFDRLLKARPGGIARFA